MKGKYISIGPNCETLDIIKNYKCREVAYPFDYIFSTLPMIKHCIEDNFQTFLNEEYYIKGSKDNSTKHSFYDKYIDNEFHRMHYDNNKNPPYEGGKYVNLFNHHDLFQVDIYDAFCRRCARFMNLLKDTSDGPIYFIYHDKYSGDICELVDFSLFLKKIAPHILIIGIFKDKSHNPSILYVSSNCVIYNNFSYISILGS